MIDKDVRGEMTDETRKVLFAIYREMPFFAELRNATAMADLEICEHMLGLQHAALARLVVVRIGDAARLVFELTDAGKYQGVLLTQRCAS